MYVPTNELFDNGLLVGRVVANICVNQLCIYVYVPVNAFNVITNSKYLVWHCFEYGIRL